MLSNRQANVKRGYAFYKKNSFAICTNVRTKIDLYRLNYLKFWSKMRLETLVDVTFFRNWLSHKISQFLQLYDDVNFERLHQTILKIVSVKNCFLCFFLYRSRRRLTSLQKLCFKLRTIFFNLLSKFYWNRERKKIKRKKDQTILTLLDGFQNESFFALKGYTEFFQEIWVSFVSFVGATFLRHTISLLLNSKLLRSFSKSRKLYSCYSIRSFCHYARPWDQSNFSLVIENHVTQRAMIK